MSYLQRENTLVEELDIPRRHQLLKCTPTRELLWLAVRIGISDLVARRRKG